MKEYPLAMSIVCIGEKINVTMRYGFGEALWNIGPVAWLWVVLFCYFCRKEISRYNPCDSLFEKKCSSGYRFVGVSLFQNYVTPVATERNRLISRCEINLHMSHFCTLLSYWRSRPVIHKHTPIGHWTARSDHQFASVLHAATLY